MKKTASVLLILLAVLVAACQKETPEATVAPEPTTVATVAPTKETAPEPTATAAAAESAAKEEPAEAAAETGDTTSSSLDKEIAQLAAIAPPPQLSDRELGIHTVPCLPGTSPGVDKVEGEDYTCGVFTVPQSWDEPDGRYLDLAFAVINATGENPEPDPMIFLSGGPGQSALFSMDASRYQKLWPDRDIILFDIRGVGLSQRLGVEECLVLALQNGAPAEQTEVMRLASASALAAARGEEASQVPDIWELNVPLLNEACWEQFSAQGLDPSRFTTAASARDVVELIKALGHESFNVHGTSYGTRLAMAIMDDIPGYDGAPQLRSVVLDSAFPPSVFLIRTIVRSDHDFILQLLDDCQADAACNEAYPNLKGRLSTLLDRLEEEPLTHNGETVTIDDVADQLTAVGGTRAAFMPKMIAELEAGVFDTYLALRDGQVGTDMPEGLTGIDLDPSDPVQAFLIDGSALFSDQAAAEFMFYVGFGLLQEDPLAALQAIIEESYTGDTGDQLLEMLETLTAEEIATSPYVAQLAQDMLAEEGEGDPEEQLTKLRMGVTGGSAHLLFSSIHCTDDIQFERFEDAVNSYNDLLFPQLTNLDQSRAEAGRCENWLVAEVPIEVKDPVTSDVPVMVLQGAYDRFTPVYMGRRAARELENSTYVLVPQAGHAVWNNADDCVGQIATAFVQNPDAELDLSCLDSRRPQWALPGDAEH